MISDSYEMVMWLIFFLSHHVSLLATAAPGPAYFPGQTVYPSSAPIIVPTAPQQPPPAKREKKPVSVPQLAHHHIHSVRSSECASYFTLWVFSYHSAVDFSNLLEGVDFL